MALEALNSPTGTSNPKTFQFESKGQQQLRYLENWTKGERSKRSQSMDHQPTEEEYLVLCLIMLARSNDFVSQVRSLPPPVPVMKIHMPSEKIEEKMLYKCSVCGKGFGSYQSLEGQKLVIRNSSPVAAEEMITRLPQLLLTLAELLSPVTVTAVEGLTSV